MAARLAVEGSQARTGRTVRTVRTIRLPDTPSRFRIYMTLRDAFGGVSSPRGHPSDNGCDLRDVMKELIAIREEARKA